MSGSKARLHPLAQPSRKQVVKRDLGPNHINVPYVNQMSRKGTLMMAIFPYVRTLSADTREIRYMDAKCFCQNTFREAA